MPLTSFGSANGSLALTVNAPSLTVLGNTNTLSIAAAGYTRSLTFVYGAGATALYVNQCVNLVRSISASGSDTLTLSALAGTASPTTLYDVLNQATPAFARIKGLLIELLTTGDTVGSSDPTPTAASSINIGNATTNKWTAVINSTGTIPLLTGASVQWVSRTAAGFVVTAASDEQLKLANADASLAAIYRMVIFGNAT